MSEMHVIDIDGKKAEEITLDAKVFDGSVSKSMLYQVVNMYRANNRRGTANTKTRGEVSGGGKKPWRQKGTGRARVGSNRNPLWKGGGVVFGPHSRDFSYSIPGKIKGLGLRDSINSKISSNNLIILKDLDLKEPKTKFVSKLLTKLKVSNSCLLVYEGAEDKNFTRAAKNINNLILRKTRDVNAYNILSCEKLIVTKAALEGLMSRIKNAKG